MEKGCTEEAVFKWLQSIPLRNLLLSVQSPLYTLLVPGPGSKLAAKITAET